MRWPERFDVQDAAVATMTNGLAIRPNVATHAPTCVVAAAVVAATAAVVVAAAVVAVALAASLNRAEAGRANQQNVTVVPAKPEWPACRPDSHVIVHSVKVAAGSMVKPWQGGQRHEVFVKRDTRINNQPV
jgi:hypothetical protein